jgi:hypothetical protein
MVISINAPADVVVKRRGHEVGEAEQCRGKELIARGGDRGGRGGEERRLTMR